MEYISAKRAGELVKDIDLVKHIVEKIKSRDITLVFNYPMPTGTGGSQNKEIKLLGIAPITGTDGIKEAVAAYFDNELNALNKELANLK